MSRKTFPAFHCERTMSRDLHPARSRRLLGCSENTERFYNATVFVDGFDLTVS